MLFKFIEKPITIDFFTCNPGAYHHAPIVKANKLMPSWIKSVKGQQASDGVPESTVKQCNGFVDYFKNAFTIPLWSDVVLGVSEEGNDYWHYRFADQRSEIQIHPDVQRGTYLPSSKYQHFKLVSPWMAVSSKSVNVHWTSPTWSLDEPDKIVVLPAVVDYAYTHGTHVNIVIPKTDKDQNIILKAGQPMVNIVPMTERKVNVKCHLVDEKEYESINQHTGNVYFNNRINRHKGNPLTCPFGFGKSKKA